MKSALTKDQLLALLGGGLLYFTGNFIVEVRASIDQTAKNASQLGVLNGVDQKMIQVMMDMGIMKSRFQNIEEKLDSIAKNQCKQRGQ